MKHLQMSFRILPVGFVAMTVALPVFAAAQSGIAFRPDSHLSVTGSNMPNCDLIGYTYGNGAVQECIKWTSEKQYPRFTTVFYPSDGYYRDHYECYGCY